MSWGLGIDGIRHRRFWAEDSRRVVKEELSGDVKAVENGMESSEFKVMHW